MQPESFIVQYETALGTQEWASVSPLISAQATVTFSTGKRHHGKAAIQKAFEHNFSMIKSEDYKVREVKWLAKEENFAVFTFEYYWKGIIQGTLMEGNGIGTSVLIKENENWVLLSEHLGRKG